ncbi:hypothetical protein WI76_03905 [Burkholderia ubonensis]|nr:hypothetical protein WI76_03905 [Burkholderia ubonensis]
MAPRIHEMVRTIQDCIHGQRWGVPIQQLCGPTEHKCLARSFVRHGRNVHSAGRTKYHLAVVAAEQRNDHRRKLRIPDVKEFQSQPSILCISSQARIKQAK